jgi:phage terminase large subunit GpA-like protein
VKDPRARDSGNTTLHKIFPGGHITSCGANSPASLASRPVRIVLCDEVDRYPLSAGSEGDPVSLARKRATTFWNRKIGMFSTPTVKGLSRIEQAFLESDKRRFYVACPDCGEKQTLKWGNVVWTEPKDAKYACSSCGSLWDDAARSRAIKKGEWIAEGEKSKVAGFHLSGLYSPWTPLADSVEDFLQAKKQPATLRVWVNTFLGETWEDQGEAVDDFAVSSRVESWDMLPKSVLLLTAGVDVQDDRLEIEIVGWGRDEESWSVDFKTIWGDPSSKTVWDDLDNLLLSEYPREDDRNLNIKCTLIDSGGHHTNSVYNYVRPREGKRVFATKGVGGEGKPLMGKPSRNNIGKIKLFPCGVDSAKELLYSRLKIVEPGPGYCHFPPRPDEYFKQLTAEKLVTRYHKGFARREWVKVRSRNEALDCRVYAMGALAILNLNLMAVEAQEATVQAPRPIMRKPQHSGFVHNWR